MKHGTEETHECLYGLANVAKDLLCGYGTHTTGWFRVLQNMFGKGPIMWIWN